MLIPWLGRGWSWLLHAGFLLLCLRFLVAATRETYPDVLPVLVLIVGGLGLSAWRPQAALFAFTVAVPLLNGLGYVGLAGLPAPVSLVFSGIFLGFSLKEAQRGANELWRGRQDEFSRKKAQEAQREEAQGADPEVTDQVLLSGQRSQVAGHKSDLRPMAHDPGPGRAVLATDVLITVVLASLVMQVARHHDSAGFWKVCWSQSVFGFGDPFYFMTSAFLWLQGLFFFRLLIEGAEEKCQGPSPFAEASADKSAKGQGAERQRGMREEGSEGEEQEREKRKAENEKYDIEGEATEAKGRSGQLNGQTVVAVKRCFTVSAWVRPVLAIYGVTLAIFYLLQVSLHIPEPYVTWTYNPKPIFVSFNMSPYEDISSFGSIAVAVFAFVVASQYKTSWPKMVFRYLWIIGLLALVVASWSRGAWLAGAVTLLFIAWLRLPKKLTVALVGLGGIAIVILNLNANRESWNQSPYLTRLITLVRFENLGNKDPNRVRLYQKATVLIREHPLTGHGIGSFYLTSRSYARPGDRYAVVPDFAHNVFLQVAAELGVPAAALFAALIVCALWRGYRAARSHRGDRRGKRKEERQEFGAKDKFQNLELLGVTMALTAYLLTQMTANSLNVYVSNQFFFWFLMAALLSFNTEIAEAYPSASISVD